MQDWLSTAIQSGCGVAVCAMFLWYLNQKRTEDKEQQEAYLTHLKEKDQQHATAVEKLMQYITSRDQQISDMVQKTHDALSKLSQEMASVHSVLRAYIHYPKGSSSDDNPSENH